jgi:TRAP-type C4-dicarboxylate transport system substrate-binding protein
MVCIGGYSEAEGKDTIEFKYNDFNAAGIGITQLAEKTLNEVETLTEGRVEIACYFSGSLLKYPETFQGISSGIADISYYMVGGTPGVHQLNELFNLPFLGFKNIQSAADAYNTLLEQYHDLQKENEKFNLRWLAIHPMLPFHLNMTNKIIKTPKDMKGEKILAEGHNARFFSAIGATAMNFGPSEWYTSLQKGVVSGHFTHLVVPMEFKTDELLKYHTLFGDGGGGNGCIGYLVNLDSWSKISSEDQKTITEVFQKLNDESVKLDIELQKKALERIKQDKNHTIEKLTPEEVELWKNASKSTIEKWITETEKKGLPGRKLYEAVTELANK